MEKENITNRLKNLINWSKNISNVTISDIKYKLTDIKEIHEELLFLHINQTLGMVKISDCVHILNQHPANFEHWKGTDVALVFSIITSKSAVFVMKVIFPILLHLNMLSFVYSNEEPILIFDESKGYLTYNDIVCKLLPSLVLDDGSIAGYAALSSFEDVCLVINMKIKNSPLQEILDSSYGKSIINNVSLQNAKIETGQIGKIIFLLNAITNYETLCKSNINYFDYKQLIRFDYYPIYQKYIFNFIEDKYKSVSVNSDVMYTPYHCNTDGFNCSG